MIRTFSNIMASLVLMISMAGCYKDKGNYAYHAINDITITTVSDTFQVNQFDTLGITPGITGRLSADTGRLRYEWSVYLSGIVDITEPAFSTSIVLSDQRNLHVRIGLNPETGGYYSLTLKVTDTVTGVAWFKNIYLKVGSTFQTGWMLLEQKGDHSDISFITPQNALYFNVFSTANPDKVLPPTASVLASVDPGGGGLGILNFVLYDNEGYYLDKTSLQATRPYSKMFYGTLPVVQPQGILLPDLLSDIHTFNAGLVYSLNAVFGGATLFGAAFQKPDAAGYYMAPFIAGGFAYGSIFFDQANYRFLYDGETTTLTAFPSDNTMAFDLNNVHKTMLTMQPGLGDISLPDNWYALFRDLNDDSCFVYTLDANEDPVAQARQPILNSPNVQRAVSYQFSNTLKQMYYAVDNQLYVYDMAANRSRLVYQFAGGENATTMKMRDNTIVIATYNGNQSGGTVYFLPLSSTGDIQGNTFTQKFTGFDKIVNIVYKIG